MGAARLVLTTSLVLVAFTLANTAHSMYDKS